LLNDCGDGHGLVAIAQLDIGNAGAFAAADCGKDSHPAAAMIPRGRNPHAS